jgi:hypothetical protein
MILGSSKDPWQVDVAPNDCPICHRAIDPRFLAGVYREQDYHHAIAELVFQCPHHSCLHVFIGRYAVTYEPMNRSNASLELRATTPYSPLPPAHPPAVEKLSPQFVEIYRQAAAAEGWRLGEIAGGGYRKALEFLIKDYAISLHPTEAEAIKSKLLMPVISEYIDDANIKASAARAAWLGNDETHYERRWSDKDIEDLKKLIAVTESWVNTHLLTQQYLKDMPDPKAKSQA